MERIIPLVGNSVKGPLGVVHLPRLWLKALLKSVDLLAEGYLSGGARGFDRRLIEGLGLDSEATFAFLGTLPSYPQFERWVRAHAPNLDPATIERVNAGILAHERPAEISAEVRSTVGLMDDQTRNGVMLNNLDDWHALHARLAAAGVDGGETIVPAVSSESVGPIGAKHLARFWAKALLDSFGRLADGYRSGPARVVYLAGKRTHVEVPRGLDALAMAHYGIDMAAAIGFIKAEWPTYLQFEAWVRSNARDMTAAVIALYNADPQPKPEEKALRELRDAGEEDLSIRRCYLINDLLDWTELHRIVTAQRVA